MSLKTNVLIGVQARSTSERFPGKVFEKIGSKMMLQHVLDACQESAKYFNRHTDKHNITVQVALLIPVGDKIKNVFVKTRIHEGPEHDVLTRYAEAAAKFEADYVVRVTGDCPLILSPVITKHVNTIVKCGKQYVSNVHEGIRLMPDGLDCEAFTVAALRKADQSASDKSDREHVTTWMRKNLDKSEIGHVLPFYSLLSLGKLSVDTPEDLERVRANYKEVQESLAMAERLYGRESVHRF